MIAFLTGILSLAVVSFDYIKLTLRVMDESHKNYHLIKNQNKNKKKTKLLGGSKPNKP